MSLSIKEQEKKDTLVYTFDKVLQGDLSVRVDLEGLSKKQSEYGKRLNMLIDIFEKSEKEKEMYINIFGDSFFFYEGYIYCFSAFNRIGDILNNTFDVSEICKSTIKICKEELDFKDYIIALKSKGRPGLKIYREDGKLELEANSEFLKVEGMINKVFKKEESIFITQHEEIKHFKKLLSKNDLSSILLEPIISNKKAVGAIGFVNGNEKGLDPGYEKLLGILSNFFGHVITIADLYKDTRLKSKEIKNSKNKLQALFDGISDMILVVNKDFEITMANYKLAEFCNTTPRDIIGKKCYSSCYQKEDICQECPSLKTFDSKKPQFKEFTFGNEILQLWTYPMFNSDGELEFVIEYAKFITEQKKLERQIQQAEKMSLIGHLATTIAHEIRNPLSGILTTAQLLEEEFDQDDQRKMDMQDITQEIHRIEKLINEMLSFSKPQPLQFNSVDIHDILNMAFSFLRKEAKRHNIEIVEDFDRTLPKIKIDPNRIQQVFLNLMLNAIESMANGGRLKISTNRSEEWIEIKFIDSGIGISKENLNKIFDPFFSTKTKNKGTGLGLSVSYKIIKDHKGEIEVESKQGKGTTFTVRLKI